MTWISFRVPNVCEALKTQKNPRHVPCPLKSNRTAVGLTRQSILFAKTVFRPLPRTMDARVKPAHDGERLLPGTPPSQQPYPWSVPCLKHQRGDGPDQGVEA